MAEEVFLRDTEFVVLSDPKPMTVVLQSGNTADFGRSFRTISGQSFPEVDKSDFAGQYIVGDAVGNPIPSAGTVTGGDATLRTDLANPAAGGHIVAFKASGIGAVARTASDKLDDSFSVIDFGRLGGGADDTAAFVAAQTAGIAEAKSVSWPGGESIVSAITAPAGSSIRPIGPATVVKQKAGTAANTRIISVTGSNVELGAVTVEGQLNQGGDTTGEQNHGGFIQGNATNGDLSVIRLGNIVGKNIRGDPLYIGAQSGHKVSQISVGHVRASNAYRNAITIAGGASALSIESIIGGSAGLRALDIEPNSGEGDVSGVSIRYIEGRAVGIVATGQKITGISIGTMRLDPTAYGSGATPTYTSEDFSIAVKYRDADFHIGKLEANGFSGSAVSPVAGGLTTSRVAIDHASLTNCCTDNGSEGFISGYGAAFTTIAYRIGFLKAATTNASHRILQNINGTSVGHAEISLITGSRYLSDSQNCLTFSLILSKGDAGNGGTIASGSTRALFIGGKQDCDRFFSFCTRSAAIGVEVTATTGVDVSGTNNAFLISQINGSFYYLYGLAGVLSIDGAGNGKFASLDSGSNIKVGGVQVLSSRKASVANAVNAAAAPTQAEFNALVTQFNALLSRLRATGGHGLIAD